MPKAVWDDTGTRTFEAGIDHGMLYVGYLAGVPWNGLVSVSENPSGGDPREYFADGEKYLNLAGPEEYAATITAFSSPPEFASCTGRLKLSPGLFADGQPNRKFGFSYRTLIGDDLQGLDAGYKIHIIYNAMAKVPNFTHQSIGDRSSVSPRSWDITTVPEMVSSYAPSSHYIADSTKISLSDMEAIEDILYGTVAADPRLPSPDELQGILLT